MRLYKALWNCERINLESKQLGRKVVVDFYFPQKINFGQKVELLLFNDGQILEEMHFLEIIQQFYRKRRPTLLVVAAIHANEDRLLEYGTIDIPNYKGQGARAGLHGLFILQELLPYAFRKYPFLDNVQVSIAGFSLGGLAAFDLAWTHPYFFQKVGVFSGSFWWRVNDLKDDYNEQTDRIAHHKVRQALAMQPHIKFFFECGTEDESSDRNHNGIIDSIDDTQDLIHLLTTKGYRNKEDICYYEIKGGKHDVPTWKDAMPVFLEWGWGK